MCRRYATDIDGAHAAEEDEGTTRGGGSSSLRLAMGCERM